MNEDYQKLFAAIFLLVIYTLLVWAALYNHFGITKGYFGISFVVGLIITKLNMIYMELFIQNKKNEK